MMPLFVRCLLIGLALLRLTLCTAQERFSIESIRVNGKSVPHNKGVQLKALDDDIVFGFTPHDSAVYHYQLIGHDKNELLSNYPEIHYNDLKGGEYTLKAHLSKGKLKAACSVPISVEASLTESWWFIPSVVAYGVVLISAGVYFFLLYTFRQKLKVQHLRNRIAADLHDEVGATLSSIAIATKVVEHKLKHSANADLIAILDQIKHDSEESIQHIRDTVWTINPDNDSLPSLFEKIRSFAVQILRPSGILVDFNNEIPPDKTFRLSMEQRRNVYLIVKEAINNVAKHAEATVATIRISEYSEGIHIVVVDNGKGFDPTQQTTGNGLRNFNKRAQESFIELELDSSSGQGTQLSLKVLEL